METKMTGRELREQLTNIFGEGEEIPGDRDYWGNSTGINEFFRNLSHGSLITVANLGDFENVEYFSPYNESGDIDAELIFKFDNRYWKVSGYLDSWEGGCWDSGPVEVFPQAKTIREWVTA